MCDTYRKMSPTQELEKLLEERKRGVQESVYNARLMDLIYQGADVNKPFTTLKSVKTAVGRPTLLGTLIKHGANVSPPLNSGRDNVLMVAVNERSLGAVETILKNARVNVNYRNHEKQTAVMLAAMHGHMKMLELLVKAGADVHKEDEDGCNALHYAALSTSPELIPYLIYQLRLNPNKKTKRGHTALMIAVDKYMDGENSYRLKVVKELAKHSDLHIKNNEGKNIFSIIDDEWDYAPDEAQTLKRKIQNALKKELDSRLKTIYHVVHKVNQELSSDDKIHLPDDIVSKIASLQLEKVQTSQLMEEKFKRRADMQKTLQK